MLEMYKSFLPVPQRLNPTGIRIRMASSRADPLWCLADWCQMLGYADVAGAVCEWVVHLDDTPSLTSFYRKKDKIGLNHEKWYVREAAVVKVILGCQLPTAEPFQEWLTAEVLPSIHEHGYYPPPAAQQAAYQSWLAWLNACFPQHEAAVRRQQPGGFSVLSATKSSLIAVAEKLIRQSIPVEFHDCPDRLVEAWWKQRRKRQGLRVVRLEAPLELPEKSETVYVKVYGPEELDKFNEWFSMEYLPGAFPSMFADDNAAGDSVAADANTRTQRPSTTEQKGVNA